METFFTKPEVERRRLLGSDMDGSASEDGILDLDDEVKLSLPSDFVNEFLNDIGVFFGGSG